MCGEKNVPPKCWFTLNRLHVSAVTCLVSVDFQQTICHYVLEDGTLNKFIYAIGKHTCHWILWKDEKYIGIPQFSWFLHWHEFILIFLTYFLFYFCIYLACEAIGTAATPGLLCQPRVIVKMIVEKQMECKLAGETEVLGENVPQRHFYPSQNPTWPDPGLNPGRRGGKPVTNRLSYGAAFLT
jgi:hypothetical protein